MNKITGYFSQQATVCDPTTLVLDKINDIVDHCYQPFSITSAIVEDLFWSVNESESTSSHEHDRVLDKTVWFINEMV